MRLSSRRRPWLLKQCRYAVQRFLGYIILKAMCFRRGPERGPRVQGFVEEGLDCEAEQQSIVNEAVGRRVNAGGWPG
jgi:hypothetical protein